MAEAMLQLNNIRASQARTSRPAVRPPCLPLSRPWPAFQASKQHEAAPATQSVRLQAAADASTTTTELTAAQAAAPAASPLVYSGIVFDMDGTLTVSNINYKTMREKTGIAVGDLFTVMESWDDGDRIKSSMDVILELEAVASASVQAMPGLPSLLAFLRDSGVRVGLVTRNTTESLNAFFSVVGEEWRSTFDILLTRDNTPYVKPDKRALLHFAQAWGLQPWELLMVGDSGEDIETANAAGTASCLIAGGGNETAAAAAAPPPLGAVPTFTVDSLAELQRRLEQRDTALGWGSQGSGSLGTASSDSDSDDGGMAGAPPEGLEFLEWLLAGGALNAAHCSFPRIDGSRRGVPPDTHPGDRVLHLACGNGSLTKLLFSSGLQVVGVDEDVAAAQRRGLPAVQLAPLVLSAGALEPELAAMGALFDAAVFYAWPSGGGSGSSGSAALADGWARAESLAELRRVLKPGGRLCVQAPAQGEAAVRRQLDAAGFAVRECERVACGALRLVATAA